MSGSEHSREDGKQAPPDGRWRQAVITFFPMLIAVLSLFTSIYNGYLNNKFVTLIQGNLTRAEYMRTCRDVVDAYFQVKYRAEVVAREAASLAAGPATVASSAAVAEARPRAGVAPTQASIEAGNAVAKFGALATYLANMRDESIRAAYTELYWKLDKVAGMAATASGPQRNQLLKEADEIFASLNSDCVKSAAARP